MLPRPLATHLLPRFYGRLQSVTLTISTCMNTPHHEVGLPTYMKSIKFFDVAHIQLIFIGSFTHHCIVENAPKRAIINDGYSIQGVACFFCYGPLENLRRCFTTSTHSTRSGSFILIRLSHCCHTRFRHSWFEFSRIQFIRAEKLDLAEALLAELFLCYISANCSQLEGNVMFSPLLSWLTELHLQTEQTFEEQKK